MCWRYREQKEAVNNHIIEADTPAQVTPCDALQKRHGAISSEERELAENVKTLLIEGKLYLQANLKVGDVAKALNLPEYRISKALRNHLNAKNFNQYVNELRISHAKDILAEPDKKQWPVLVVGLESGFASVGPFTRAFKAQTGFTPNQYRQDQLENLALKVG